MLLDIIELTNPVHDGLYLAQKLLEVTDRLHITCAIMSVTRDNASPNNTMLDEFEAVIATQWEAIDELDQAKFCYKFNRKDGDVRCVTHIYNIKVQAGMYLPSYARDELAFEFLAPPTILQEARVNFMPICL
jgi:hypothetical protein